MTTLWAPWVLVALAVPAAAAAGETARPAATRSLLDAAADVSVSGTVGGIVPRDGLPTDDAPGGWLQLFWTRHRWHLLTSLAMVETEYLYNREVGTSRSPLMFGSAPGIDRRVDASLYDPGAHYNFVEANKTNLLRGVALGSILATDRLNWSAAADDLIGLIEAEKFNTASTQLVKQVVGRRRPALDRSSPSEIGQEAFDRRQASDAGHLSFYSASTSEAFTYCAYLDRMVARRLEAHPVWRGFSAAGFYGFASYIGYTRLRQGDHYLSDVLAGAAAGTFIGRRFYEVNHREESAGEEGWRSSRIRFNPPVPLPGGGMVSLSIGIGR